MPSDQKASSGPGELVEALGGQLRGTATGAVFLGAGVAAGLVFVGGMIMALITPNQSAFDASGGGLLREAFTQTGIFSLADVNIDFGPGVARGFRFSPATFALIPIAATFIGGLLTARLTSGLSMWGRLASGLAIGLPFAILMLIFNIAAGSTPITDNPRLVANSASVSGAGVFFLSLLWGALGGGLAGVYVARRGRAAWLDDLLDGSTRRAVAVLGAALRPLGLALLIGLVLGTGFWVVQTARNSGDIRGQRTEQRAVAENAAFAVDHGIHVVELGDLSSFRWLGNPGALPLPVAQCTKLLSASVEDQTTPRVCTQRGRLDAHQASLLSREEAVVPTFNLFDYNDALPPWAFIPLMIALILIPTALELYAGFAIARAVKATEPIPAALWGALVGPIWALAMVSLNALIRKEAAGMATGESVLVAFLIAGAGFGALGGLLASRQGAIDR